VSVGVPDTRAVLERLVVVREALQDGDLALASAIAADLEDELAAELSQSDRRSTCSVCGETFRWPGLLAAHHCTTSVAA